ncbi:SAM-dependent methyltransferase, MidA family [Paenibacillus sp. 1_12]|uniref:class I SAM-dependent methyltransferase n=1 Tax=Paenibacillus sp. 1_12 TaxID=1566278 RepID=UPI0008E8A62E|nr:SAM-dependent methyltransferase [Paenibacillus sp. 1_12]SFL32081.1 SAM-dependent methyltransferase, MidA family [Paenibacillus sp. 1_12]
MQDDHKLQEIIRGIMEQSSQQAISFRDYMELCLYHPELGYYTSSRDKVGKTGDFYTSTSIGGLLGEVLAQYVAEETSQEAWGASDQPLTLVEWGGGNGGLAQQLLDELKHSYAHVYARISYISVEISPHHRRLQAEKLAEHYAAGRVSWMTEEDWEAGGPWQRTMIFSNEFHDALPVHQIQMKQGLAHEIWVACDEAGEKFKEIWVPVKPGTSLDLYIKALESEVRLQENQRFEVNLAAPAWILRVGRSLDSGQIVTIDYGDYATEIYGEHRMNGTLMCYHNHIASDEPYDMPGKQDMTAHVNFTELIRAGHEVGLDAEKLLTQKQFLVENGLLDKLQDSYSTDPFSAVARRNRAIRQLLLSDQMSELFKVLILKKGELL